MVFHFFHHPRARRTPAALAVLLSLTVALAAACAPPDPPSKRFGEILWRYPGTSEPLKVQTLSADAYAAIPPASRGKAVTIIVHPAYSLFFRDERRSTFTEAKYDLLKYQLDTEARFISEIARTDNVLILVLPGSYPKESIAPLSYTAYLNSLTGGSATVYAVYSETSSTGNLPMDTMVTLYGFLRSIKATTVLVGGGYIGRCQREFYNQMVAYVDKVRTYVVPDISSISPDDISDRQAVEFLDSIKQKDYEPVKRLIQKLTQGGANTLPLPPLHHL